MKIEHIKYDRWQFPLSVVLQFKKNLNVVEFLCKKHFCERTTLISR